MMSNRRHGLLLLLVGIAFVALSCAGPATAPKAGLNVVATTGTQPGSVTFGIGVENTGTATEHLSFGSSQFFDIEVRNVTGHLVWQFSAGKYFLDLLWGFDLAPGEKSEIQETTWDLKGNDGDLVSPGTYTARIYITSSPRNEDLVTVVRLTI
jgi:hypothetical protein